MENFLKENNFFRDFINTIGDLMYLNALWVICSLPIFTIGASTTALYYVTLKISDGSEGNITKNFFKSFKANFKQSTKASFVFVLLGASLCISFYYWISQESFLGNTVSFLIILFSLVYIMTMLVFFPLLAKFENSLPILFKNALFISTKYILPCLTPLLLVALILLLMSKFHQIIFLLLILGASGIAQVNSYVYNDLFNKLLND